MSRAMGQIATWAVIATIAATTRADDRADFLKALETRTEPITGYELTVRQVHLDLKPDDYNDFRNSIQRVSQGQMDGATPSQWAQQLVQAWAGKPSWIEHHMTQCGDRFKEVCTQQEGRLVDIDLYDGLLYYSYSKPNNQLDVHLKMPNIGRADLASLGVGVKGPRPEQLVSFEKAPWGSRAVFNTGRSDSDLCRYDFGPHLEIKRWYSSHAPAGEAPTVETETWYLFHETIDGFRIPRAKVYLSINRPRKLCSSTVYVVEEARVNCPLAGDSLSLGEVPPNALVVDYRFGLSNQWRYSDYVQSPMNATAQSDSRARAEDFIEFLARTRGEREAASTRDARVGRVAPALEVGEWLQKSPALGKWPTGRPMVLEFWNITCGPCIASIPQHNELAAWMESKGGLFVSVHSATHEPASIREFLKTHEVRYAVGLDTPGADRSYWSSATFAAYGINGIPTCVTIGPSGRILSYEPLSKEKLEQLLEKEMDEAPRGRTNVEIRPLTLLPQAWLASDLEPGSEVQGRLFLFRPETPDLTVRAWKDTDATVRPTWVRHSTNGQTVYEVLLKAKTPDPGRVLRGRIALVAEYEQQERLLDISYELAARR